MVTQLFDSVTSWTVACQASVHGIPKARILEWVAPPVLYKPRDQTCVSCIGRWALYHATTGKAFWVHVKRQQDTVDAVQSLHNLDPQE